MSALLALRLVRTIVNATVSAENPDASPSGIRCKTIAREIQMILARHEINEN